MRLFLIWLLKSFGFFSRLFQLGAGSTWPGHIMLSLDSSFLAEFSKSYKGKIIVIAGTNGKTTTSKIIKSILEADGRKVMHNESGANLLNGIASAIINEAVLLTNFPGYAIFEIDENSLPLLLKELTPDILVILNLFRDQLDRYGEVNTVALKWKKALETLPKSTTLILNANDPEIAFLGQNFVNQYSSSEGVSVNESRSLQKSSSRQARTIRDVYYFGLSNPKLYLAKHPHAMDAVNCPNCTGRLLFDGVYLGHLGNWKCSKCSFKEPTIDYDEENAVLPGIYNISNTQAAILVAKALGIDNDTTETVLKNFTPAFGRQERFVVDGKQIRIFLSKNPTGFNESLRTVRDLGAKHLLLVLNDRIPDGRDVSWIWDVDFEEFLEDTMSHVVSGDRCFDLALRLKYVNSSITQSSNVKTQNFNSIFKIYENLSEGVRESSKILPKNETLYILPTYSAMLEVRKILTGRKIL